MAITINGNGTVTGISVGGLPDGIVDTDMIATGAVTSAKKAAGSVLQVVQGVLKASFDGNNYSSYEQTGITATIQPSSTSNKVLVEAHIYGSVDKGRWAGIRLYRGGSVVTGAISTAYGGDHYNVIDGHRQNNNWMVMGYNPDDTHHDNLVYGVSGKYLDSPSSTSSLTYDLRIIGRENATSYYINRPVANKDNDSSVAAISTITLTEIAG